MKKKLIILVILLILTHSIIFANSIDKGVARKIAENWYTERNDKEIENTEVQSIIPFKMDNILVFYICNFDNAFVIVSSDDNAVPVIGYSFEHRYTAKKHPPQFDSMLNNFKEQIKFIIQNNLKGSKKIRQEWQRLNKNRDVFTKKELNKGVNPLLSTIWDQGEYYNEMCPVDYSSTTGNDHVWAGCVATAMAQVMKYWEYPLQGSGSHGYNHPDYGYQYANFGSTTYNWSNMPNSVTNLNSDVQTLLYHCGVSVDMDYGPDGSGACSEDVPGALEDYFNYNSDLYFAEKNSYSSSTWENMLRDELDNSRPLYYSGSGTGGHAFNVDGYQGTNYFHFNWGWSGYYNGYFYLSNLNPGTHNFTQYQAAVFNIHPDDFLPTMDITPTSIDVAVAPDETTTVDLTISNDGDAPLYWEGSTFTVEKGFDPSAYPTYPEVTAGMKLKTRDDDHSCGLASQPAPNDPFGLTVDMPPRDEFGYGDVAYDPGSTIPTGPCYFDLTNPADVTNLGPAASDFIAAADYADGTWYGIVYGGTFITIDMDTGNITTIGSTCDASGMGYDWTTGTMYAVDFDGNLYTIDLDTGAQTTVATTQASLITMACSNDGTLYGFDLTNDVLGTIDKDTGTWTQIGSVGIDMNYAQDASFDHATNTLYWAAYDATTGGQLMTVDTDTGMASLIGAFPNALEMTGFTIPASADTWLSIDPTEGTIEPGTSGTVDAYLAGCDDPIGTVKEGGIEFTSPQGVPSVTVDVTLLIAPPTSGTLEGTVTDTDTNPINGAIVTAGTYQATTDASGGYTIEDIATGDYDVVASHTSYNTSDPASVTILEDQTTTQDFALTQPTMDVTPTTIEEYVAPDDPISVDVSVANNGDGPLNYTVDLIRGVETDYSDCTSGTLEKSDGTTSGGNSNGFVAEENAKDDVTIHYDGPNDDAIGLTDGGTFMVAARFTSDELGDYYGDYQLSNVELYIQDIPTNVTLKVWEGGSMGDPGTEIYSEDVTSQITDPETWTTIALTAPIDLVSDNEYWVGYEVTHDVGLYPAGCDAGPAVSGKGDWIYLDPGPWDEIANSGYSVNWNIRAVLSPGVIPWITYSPNSGYVEAGNTGTVTVDFNTVDHDVGEVLTAQLQFNSDPDVGSQNVDIQVTVGDQEATGQTEVTETALNASFPNPFTDHTTISFSLKQASNVKLSIYNVKGQLVETLVNDNMDTGIHEIEWNADSGRVGSGIYFYKLETENKSFLKKMIMMK